MQLVRLVGRGNGTVEHQVASLLKEREIVRVAAKGHTCSFAASADPGLRPAYMSMRNPAAGRILGELARSPGLGLSALARRLGLAVSTVHYHVGRLLRAQVLAARREGARLLLDLTETGRRVHGGRLAGARIESSVPVVE